tara:strand:+ start:53 stop:1375 length:1323 start_codon:yes stop_codon:yes gene_type:complete
MSTLLSHVKRSLFFRLLLIFGATVMLFILIISVSLNELNQNANEIEAIPDYFSRNIESIIEEIGTPPNLASAIALADDLDWRIDIRNPIMNWSSDNDRSLDVDSSVYSETLSNDAEKRTVGNEDIISVVRGGYEFYLYQRSIDSNNFFALYVAVSLTAIVLFFNYFMVNRLLNPVRLLKRGAERIRRGDLGYRVDSDRQDELGELTVSINGMADSLQSMLEAKRQLLLAISHELRTPITKAKLRLEFMPLSGEREQLRGDLNEIDLLISDLLEAERLNSEHSVLVAEPVQILEFVDSVLEQFENYTGGLTLIKPKQDKVIDIDKLRVRLLITNLLNNAIRHGEEKPIDVDISFNEESVFLNITDHGEGIAEEHLPNISEPFYRADRSRQRNTGGFGLGLYLCKLIAQAHGGELNISSKIGEGSQLKVRLPCHLPQPQIEE